MILASNSLVKLSILTDSSLFCSSASFLPAVNDSNLDFKSAFSLSNWVFVLSNSEIWDCNLAREDSISDLALDNSDNSDFNFSSVEAELDCVFKESSYLF
ncbi:hypothetical protein WICPIJ_001311 [Wickerhamomyces pijperi]|uniref:Uncharacterized protein n=1 Tax=Wickerhamomyces pijperi TaxID=599730 RepID=A0A9P8QBU8_WICPI|nr:hypothetical protein WICPIJ_001311 [Wickerhamomyces pijperi]